MKWFIIALMLYLMYKYPRVRVNKKKAQGRVLKIRKLFEKGWK